MAVAPPSKWPRSATAVDVGGRGGGSGGSSVHEGVMPSKGLPWLLVESLKPPTPTGDSDEDIDNSFKWHLAVAPAVTALGRIVARHIDVTATRLLPTYDAVVDKLRSLGLADKVPEFDAEWKELCSTPDGRAVITVCDAAAEGGMLLGRISTMETAEEYGLERRLAAFFKGRVYLPTLLAALHYCRDHPEATIDTVPTSEWPLLTYLTTEPYAGPRDFPSAEWYAAVAPAVMAVRRIVVPTYLPEAAAGPLIPSPASVVGMMQHLGRDDDVSKFKAAWEDLHRSSGGRAVLAVCRAAEDGLARLGDGYMARRADDPGLECELTKVYECRGYLPVLLAALHYYRGGAGGSAVSSGSSGAAAAAAAAI